MRKEYNILDRKIKLSKDIDKKIQFIKEIDDDACKYLCNIYERYYLCRDKYNTQEYLKYNKCMFQNDILEIIKYCKNNNCIIFEITKSYDKRYEDLVSLCQYESIPIVNINDEKNMNLYNIKNKYKFDNIFFDINISDINSWYNWNVVIENNLDNILVSFDKFNMEELKINTIEKVEICNSKSEKGKYEKNTGGFNVIKVINVIKRLLKIVNKETYDIIANIYIANREVNRYYVEELSEIINSLTYNNLTDKYSYIYDLLCKKLERDIVKYNYCIFNNNKCIAQRNGAKWPKNEYDGCCFDVSSNKQCKYLNSKKSCDITCISCRLFTCRYLKDRGIDYDIRKNIFSKIFLNLLQTPEFVWDFYIPKEKILNRITTMPKIF